MILKQEMDVGGSIMKICSNFHVCGGIGLVSLVASYPGSRGEEEESTLFAHACNLSRFYGIQHFYRLYPYTKRQTKVLFVFLVG